MRMRNVGVRRNLASFAQTAVYVSACISLYHNAHAQYFNTCLPSLLLSRLSQQQEVLEKQISLEDQVIKQSEEKLDGLQPALDTLQRASLPLQDMLGLPVDKMREEESLARLLPELAFLYTLSLCIRCCKENRYVLFS